MEEPEEQPPDQQEAELQRLRSTLHQARNLESSRAQLRDSQSGDRNPSPSEDRHSDNSGGSSNGSNRGSLSESSGSPQSVYHISEILPATAYSPLPKSPNDSPNASPPERWGVSIAGYLGHEGGRRGRSLTRRQRESSTGRRSSGTTENPASSTASRSRPGSKGKSSAAEAIERRR